MIRALIASLLFASVAYAGPAEDRLQAAEFRLTACHNSKTSTMADLRAAQMERQEAMAAWQATQTVGGDDLEALRKEAAAKLAEIEAKLAGKGGKAHSRGYKLPSKEVRAKMHAEAFDRHGHRMLHHVRAMTAPSVFDSTTMGWIPPIRDQGNCGDCFGVEASDALTVAFIKAGQQKADGSFVISEQYGLDCGTYPGGCNGGDGPQVYAIMKSKGFPAEKYIDASGKSVSDYPSYTARPSACRLKTSAKMWKCADWGYVTSDQSDRAPTVDEVKAGILNYGTVTFAFDAGALSGYSSGVIKRLGNIIDHEITGFLGWDDGKRAFKCRNQWGESFGEGGYFWLSYDAVREVVEAGFLTVAALPPPPPPPPPPPGPGPTPTPGAAQLIFRVAGYPDQVFPLSLTGMGKTVPDGTPQAIIDALNQVYGPKLPKVTEKE